MRGSNKICVIICAVLLLALASDVLSQETRTFETARLQGIPPVIDGDINEAVWNMVEWEGEFIQRQPYEGEEPTQQTSFKMIYDDEAVYLAVRAYDSEPDKIEKRLGRRDDTDGDWVAVDIDSYYDKRTAFVFMVNAAGVKGDFVISNEYNSDDSWDPVWYVKVGEDDQGWIAEMKVPLTQLRFAKQDSLVWGFQVLRFLHREEELSLWQHVPMDAAGWVSEFGEVKGIQGIRPKKEVELIPYVMGNIQNYEEEEGDPFATGTDFGYNAGLDGKIAVTNDLTLNFTINPDFGQVEADPSVVNLTAFEIFFEEKRPFFVEGSNIFSFKPTGGDGPMSRDNLFYSRRIGRQPHHYPDLEDNEYVKMPEATTILGALKLSGKTRNGWSIGVMESLTQKEKATIDMEGERREETVEPLTNYFNTRIQKDINKGNTIIGGMMTATNRDIADSSISYLHHSAYTGGLDFTQYWKDRTYQLNFSGLFSYIAGNQQSITEVQESPVHYYQNPDRTHVELDTNRTSLAGHGGTLSFAKYGSGHWRYVAWLTWRSPGLELNDMGYLRQADIVQQVIWVGYRIWEPFSIFRQMNINFNQWTGWDFGGNNVYSGGNVNGWMQFKNYWEVSAGGNVDGNSLDRYNLRGGPSIKVPGGGSTWWFIESDSRKKLAAELGFIYSKGRQDNSQGTRFMLDVTYRPIKNLELVLGPMYEFGHDRLQYITTVEDVPGNRYIMARIDNNMLMANIRINFSITPDLSIQYWGQPFVFVGKYTEIKKATETMSTNYYDRFHEFTPEEIVYNEQENVYHITEMDGSNVSYTIDNPDFKVFEWRSNLVARWEYIPGSAVYLVWSQGRMGDDSIGTPDFGQDMNDLFSIKPHNVFLVKLTYRLSI